MSLGTDVVLEYLRAWWRSTTTGIVVMLSIAVVAWTGRVASRILDKRKERK